VICGRPHLTLATACCGHGAHHTKAARLLVVATVIAGYGCGLLIVLLAPLLSTLGTLLGILDDDVRRCFLTAAWDRVKLGHLFADGVPGGDAAQLLGGVLDGVNQCLKRSYQ
jgi:hypothetical protein